MPKHLLLVEDHNQVDQSEPGSTEQQHRRRAQAEQGGQRRSLLEDSNQARQDLVSGRSRRAVAFANTKTRVRHSSHDAD
jgi:hypothetical protein